MKISLPVKELRYLVFRIVPLLFLTAGVWYCHQPVTDFDFDKNKMTPEQFHEARQVVWVNADSLQNLISKIEEKEPDAFSVKTGTSEWTFAAKNTRAFERIFLDGEPLSNWDTKRNPSIEKSEDEQEFSVKAKTINGITFVRMPAEIIQSIQIAN